jgi:preprotein translocase subunit SecY
MSKATLGNDLSSGGFSELKRRILFLFLAILVFRLAAYIPIPGVDPKSLEHYFNSQGQAGKSFFAMFNLFSGNAFRHMTIMALSIMPYISASIIVQMYSSISPKLIELKKEGESGRRKITQYTRIGTLILATAQAFAVARLLSSHAVVDGLNIPIFMLIAIVSLVTGTMFLLWLGEQITERGIGNGVSLIIFSGIVSRIPSALSTLFDGHMNPVNMLVIALIILAVLLVVVFVEQGQRRILVKYAKKQQGRKMYGGQNSHLPFKINMAGVIPPIFASSILMFFMLIPNLIGKDNELAQNIAQVMRHGSPLYMIVFAILVIFFGFFYTALMFNPKEIANNLRSQGGYIEGIRPGPKTADYIDSIVTRLTAFGTIYLALVSLLPMFLINMFNVSFYFGGTSLLIVVVVLMDLMQQVQSHLLAAQYQSLMKKSKSSRGGLIRK